jgi:hypothetical protein
LIRSDDGKICTLCFLAPHEAGFFQPGDGGANAGVVGGDVALEAALLVFIENFAEVATMGSSRFFLR